MRGLPYLYSGRTYTLRVRGRDKLGNTGEEAVATCLVSFTDTTPPPAPQARIAGTEPLRVVWQEANDAESGTAEYQMAAATAADLSANPDLLRWQSVGRGLECTYEGNAALPANYYIFVKAINGLGQESLTTIKAGMTLPAIPVTPAPPVPKIIVPPKEIKPGVTIIK